MTTCPSVWTDSGVDLELLVQRHRYADWGDVTSDEWAANDDALLRAGEVRSMYHVSSAVRVWVATARDRSRTTIELATDEPGAARRPTSRR